MVKSNNTKMTLLVKVIQVYVEVAEGDDVRGLYYTDGDLLRKNLRAISMISNAITLVEKILEHCRMMEEAILVVVV